jgi:hypothetical protein
VRLSGACADIAPVDNVELDWNVEYTFKFGVVLVSVDTLPIECE